MLSIYQTNIATKRMANMHGDSCDKERERKKGI
jgi:hypothetical protein